MGGIIFASESDILSRDSNARKGGGQWPTYEVQQMPNIDPHPSHLTDTSINSKNHNRVFSQMPRPKPRYSNFLAQARQLRSSTQAEEGKDSSRSKLRKKQKLIHYIKGKYGTRDSRCTFHGTFSKEGLSIFQDSQQNTPDNRINRFKDVYISHQSHPQPFFKEESWKTYHLEQSPGSRQISLIKQDQNDFALQDELPLPEEETELQIQEQEESKQDYDMKNSSSLLCKPADSRSPQLVLPEIHKKALVSRLQFSQVKSRQVLDLGSSCVLDESPAATSGRSQAFNSIKAEGIKKASNR